MKHYAEKKRGIALFSALSFIFLGCTNAIPVTNLKMAHGLDQTHPVHRGMVFMAQRVKKKSGGKLTISIYPSQQLGTERECIELLQIGSLAMTKVSASVLEGFVPSYKVFSLPYIFRDNRHRFAVFEGTIGRELLLKPQKYRLRGLCYYDAGNRSFYTKERPVMSPGDLTGLKIRTQESATSVKLVKAMGASATPISWGELYTSLQQGVVDGAENNPPSFYLSKHYEVCKYYSLNEHTGVPDVLLISTSVWNGLSSTEKQWLQEAADESYHYQKKLWKESSDRALEKVRRAGVKVTRPPKGPFMKKARSILDNYRSNKDIVALIKRIQSAQ